MIFKIFVLFSLCMTVQSLIGYDCGTPGSDITTISLLGVGKCEIPDDNIKSSQKYIQLLQLIDYHETKVIQCKFKINRQVVHCGWNSYASVVDGGRLQYIKEVSREDCLTMHRTREYIYKGIQIDGLIVNGTVTRSVTLAGSTDSSGYCTRGKYNDDYGSWNDVVVTGYFEITLLEYSTQVKLESDEIFLKSKTICTLTNLQCMDSDGGNTFWNQLPQGDCDFNKYGVLYNGYANKTEADNNGHDQIVYSMETQQVTFGLRTKGYEYICGYKIIRTEHPKLFVIETSPDKLIVNREVSTINLDTSAYVNSKFVYLERHIKMHMKSLYRDMFMQRCNVERETIQNSLILATLAPDEFAMKVMKGPGYMAVVAGEVVHIMKCIATEIVIEDRQECFDHLAVTRNNESYFMTPRTHILINRGVQIPCNSRIPPYYFLGNNWYKINPSPNPALPPKEIKPLTNITWNYTDLNFLAESGIYPQHRLNNFKDHVLFKMNEKSVVNKFVRGAIGESVIDQGESLVNLLDKKSLKKIAESAWEETWGRFITFGTASAGVIGIVMMIRIIKLAIDTVIHGYALHEAYGCSFVLLGAIWDSLTALLLWLAGRNKENVNGRKAIENIEVGIIQPASVNSVGTVTNQPSAPAILTVENEHSASISTTNQTVQTPPEFFVASNERSIYPQISSFSHH